MELPMKSLISLLMLACLSLVTPVSARAFEPFPSIMDHTTFLELDEKSKREYVHLLMVSLVDLEEGHRRIQQLPATPQNEQLKKTSSLRLEQFRGALTTLLGQLGVAEAYAGDKPRVRANAQVVPFPTIPARTTPPARAATATVSTILKGNDSSNSQYCHDFRGNTVGVVKKGDCVIGGWKSTYIQNSRTGAKYCQRPACSVDPKIREQFVKAQAGCGTSKSMMACNPSIYGTQNVDGTGAPFCINADQVDTQNASLACLIEFEKRPNMDERLDAIVDKLTNGNDPAAVNNFNAVARMIFNICACGPTLAAQSGLFPDYVSYMQGHRTCYSLMGMMRLYVNKIKTKSNVCNQLVVNSENIEMLSKDLGALENYTNRVAVLGGLSTPAQLTATNYSSILQKYRSRFVTDSASAQARNLAGNQAVANNDVALDHVANFDSSLNNTSANQKAWCPLALPTPLPEMPILTTGTGGSNSTLTAETKDTPEEEPAEIVVIGKRPDPLVLVEPDFPKVNINIDPIPGLQIEEPTTTTGPKCTMEYSVSLVDKSLQITGTLTTDPADYDLTGKKIKWTFGDKTWEENNNKSLTQTVAVTTTLTPDTPLTVEVPGCGACSVTKKPSETPEEVPEDDTVDGECSLTAQASGKKLKLAVLIPDSYTLEKITWTPAAPGNGDTETSPELELNVPAKTTSYKAVVEIKGESGTVLRQECSVDYPKTSTAAPANRMAPPVQPMVQPLGLPDFIRNGVN